MTIVIFRWPQERVPDVLFEFHQSFKGMTMNFQRYHMSTIVERVRPNHLVDHINQLPLKVSCAVIVKQRASLETYLKVYQSPEIPYANHPLDQTIFLWYYMNRLPFKESCGGIVTQLPDLGIDLTAQQEPG